VRTTGRTFVCTGLALLAFAANSILCRLALGPREIDAASFSSIRLASGAVTLLILASLSRGGGGAMGGTWLSALLLFLYAAPFSFAYISLGAGTGALILFGSVQATMILAAFASGERPRPLQWAGLALALSGLVSLVLPGLSAPPLAGFSLMTIAGISWGVYSLRGRRTADPLADTTGTFVRSVPMVLAVSLVSLRHLHLSRTGMALAAASGVLASGLGYVIWYEALAGLTATRAAAVQLSVPVLAAAGGIIFLSERLSLRLVVAAMLILGGVALVLVGRERMAPSRVAP
jgi:drug/metabolite transporter (DMT)-like permease